MSSQKLFVKEVEWPLSNSEKLNISLIESRGEALEDLISNCLVYIEDWHGNQGPGKSFEELSEHDQGKIIREFKMFLNGQN